MLNKPDIVQSVHKRGQRGDAWGHKKAPTQKSKYLSFAAISATNLGKSPNSL